jgi:hypothetical protein
VADRVDGALCLVERPGRSGSLEPVMAANTTVMTLRASRLGAGGASLVTHDVQKRATSGFAVPQFGHVTMPGVYDWGTARRGPSSGG